MSPVPFENQPAEADIPAVPVGGPQNAADATLSEAWVTIRSRKKLIIGMALLGGIYGFYQGATQPRLYVASGTIEIRSGSSNEYRIGGVSSAGDARLPTEVAILKSSSLLLSVARDRNLANDPAFMGPSTHYRNVDDPAIRNSVVGSLQADISVSVIPKTDLVVISCTTGNAQLSADIVNQLVHDYITHSFQSRADATKRVADFFSTQLDDLKQQVETSQEQMLELQKRLGVLGFDPRDNQITSMLNELSTAAGSAEIARIAAQTRYQVLASMDPSILDQAGNAYAPSNVSGLRAQLYLAQTNLAQLNAIYGPNNPKEEGVRNQIAELNKEIAEEETRILSETKQAYIAAKAQETQTNAALDDEKTAAYKLRDDLLQYTLREREFESNRTLYDGLKQRLRTAGVEAGLESTEIEPIDTAYPPLGPSLKPRMNIFVVNSFVMLILGVILAFILESLDTGLRSVAEIESVSGLPSMALIPRSRRNTSDDSTLSTAMRNLGTLSTPKSQFSEAFRALRTSLLLSVAGGEPKVILLTSATPSEGKTTVSINLACVLAQRNVRVLIIDADLRRPTVHHRFGLNGKVGLTSVLTGSVSLEDAIQTVPEIPQLDVLVSGPVPPFPTEMLGSDTMRHLLERCKGMYTHIVMDSPPLLSVTDSVVLARDADAVVMIVRHGKSSKHAMRRARDLLLRSGAPVTGIVLNAVDLNSPEYYAYYGYYGYTGYAAAGVDSAGWDSKATSKERNTKDNNSQDSGKGGTA
ncbi:MAG: polysaccharide biosynthesis tyrosine autokinase [Acidobacteria bacterium]|nr:polysaccharide biosynthesis tyrosine autokinase [Acidobacteriota bacterium]